MVPPKIKMEKKIVFFFFVKNDAEMSWMKIRRIVSALCSLRLATCLFYLEWLMCQAVATEHLYFKYIYIYSLWNLVVLVFLNECPSPLYHQQFIFQTTVSRQKNAKNYTCSTMTNSKIFHVFVSSHFCSLVGRIRLFSFLYSCEFHMSHVYLSVQE